MLSNSSLQDYITWLKQQRIGPVYIDLTGRSDATEVWDWCSFSFITAQQTKEVSLLVLSENHDRCIKETKHARL